MKIISGKLKRPQRVVIYGVESVGKTTFAAQFPKPLFLDIEGGTNHLSVDRAEINSWRELADAVKEIKDTDYETVVIDSADWAERLAVEDLLAMHKKQSIEDFGFGKGWVMVAEKISRFLTALDGLIDNGRNVVLLAHSKVQRVEPPDILAAYDRYELKLSKQSSPLVKEWADELWFFRFKTKAVQQDGGKAKGIGGKERVIYTTHSAAYDAKTRSGLAEEIPMAWESVAHIFATTPAEVKAPVRAAYRERLEDFAAAFAGRENEVEAFLLARGQIAEGQTWRDAAEYLEEKVAGKVDKFLQAVSGWKEAA
jgi:hypothetical protein